MNYSNVIDTIVKSVLDAISYTITTLPFDKTSTGKILKVNGHNYTVAVFGKEYVIYSSRDFKVGQQVAVTAMQNDFKRLIMTEI